jgi:Protein of unknown function (DUF4242)
MRRSARCTLLISPSRTRYLRYWFSKEAKVVHCLVEAPDADTAARVHIETTGSGPEEI